MKYKVQIKNIFKSKNTEDIKKNVTRKTEKVINEKLRQQLMKMLDCTGGKSDDTGWNILPSFN